MNPQIEISGAHFTSSSTPAGTAISQGRISSTARINILKQRGVVLFFTLIALLAMSLAAVSLIRSVDTSAMITGNLAFKQSATNSADTGIAAAMLSLQTMATNSALSITTNDLHPYNQTNLAVNRGYYSSYDFALNNSDPDAWAVWNNPVGYVDIGTDASGNQVSYIIQRMCRYPDKSIQNNDCLLAAAGSSDGGNGTGVKAAPDFCKNCNPAGLQPAQIRITVRSKGPNNSKSFVQGFVY
jgi:Tfp pilus assembly protein PilX